MTQRYADVGWFIVELCYEILPWLNTTFYFLFTASDFASSVPSDLVDACDDNEKLGRLDMSTVDGIDSDSKYTDLFSFGSRSFSLYRLTDFTRVYDSGDEFERVINETFPSIFNSNPNSESDTPEESMDTRSDNRVRESSLVFVEPAMDKV